MVFSFAIGVIIFLANCWRAQQASRLSPLQCECSLIIGRKLVIISSDSLAESATSHAAEICSSHNLLFVQTAGKFLSGLLNWAWKRCTGKRKFVGTSATAEGSRHAVFEQGGKDSSLCKVRVLCLDFRKAQKESRKEGNMLFFSFEEHHWGHKFKQCTLDGAVDVNQVVGTPFSWCQTASCICLVINTYLFKYLLSSIDDRLDLVFWWWWTFDKNWI